MNSFEEIEHAGCQVIKSFQKLSTFLNLLTDEIPDLLLCEAEQNGHFTWLSMNWQTILGWTQEELKAKPWVDFVHPNDREATQQAKMQMRAHEIINFVNRYKCKDGTWVKLRWKAQRFNGVAWCVARPMTNTDTRVDYDLRK